jgi:hypothetical protein
MDVAVVSVVSTAAVGLVGIVTPVLSRRGERDHGRALHLRDQRAHAYERLSRTMILAQGLDERVTEESAEAGIFVALWGSREVREQFTAWVGLLPTVFGPDVTDEAKRRFEAAGEASRTRMADELQGRIKTR